MSIFGKMKVWGFAAVSAIALTGCTTYYKDVAGDYLMAPQSTSQTSYYTQYEISPQRVEGVGSATVVLGFIHVGENKYCRIGSNPNLTIFDAIFECLSPSRRAISSAKAASLYNICEKNSADYLVGTTFQYTITNGFIYAQVKCKTIAYPARVKQIGEATPIILDKEQRVEYVNPNLPVRDFSKDRVLKIQK